MQDSPLIVYVHIPKTAGTTVISVLNQCSHLGLNLHLNRDGLRFRRSELESLDWVSAHLAADTFKQLTMWIKRRVELYSSVRNPISRIISHLNYSFEQVKQEDYNSHHSTEQIAIDADVLTTDFTKPTSIIGLLCKHKYHFLNIQAQYLLGSDYASLSKNEIQARLSNYKYISHEKTLNNLYSSFEFARIPETATEIKLNVSQPHFDYSIFNERELLEFLKTNNSWDEIVYELARDMFSDVELKSSRASYLLEDASDRNFSEEFYLAANPDVALAVSDGIYPSGRCHFDSYGKKEARKIRVVWPAV